MNFLGHLFLPVSVWTIYSAVVYKNVDTNVKLVFDIKIVGLAWLLCLMAYQLLWVI